MLSGGEKSKLKRLVHGINDVYPEILDLLEVENLRTNQRALNRLFEINKDVFKWISNLPLLMINRNKVINIGFDKLQASNRTKSLNMKNTEDVEKLLTSIDAIYDLQKEFIKLVDEDSNIEKNVLRQIMDELGMELPKSEKETRSYSSIDDLFADLED